MSQPKRLHQVEFITLIALLFASIALSVDTTLPGLPDIGAELSPDNLNNAQFVITSFVLGMGLGTLFVGPLSDTFGRKPVILCGAFLYCISAYASYTAQSLEALIISRMLMGISAAAPRAVSLAIVRDLYSGRDMARIMSFAMMVFSLVPAMAPLSGAFIIDIWGWREIFLGFIVFMLVVSGWLAIRQPETLPPEKRKPLRWRPIQAGIYEIMTNRVVVIAILVLALNFGLLFATLVSIQPTFDITFGRGESFPWWFALTALLAMTSSMVNAWLVGRLGMRFMISWAMAVHSVFTSSMALLTWAGAWPEVWYFPVYFVWITSIFWMIGLTIGNLNALAMQPLGHLAGLGSSVISAVATVLGVLVAVPIGLSFDGTPLPIMVGVALTTGAGAILIRFADRA